MDGVALSFLLGLGIPALILLIASAIIFAIIRGKKRRCSVKVTAVVEDYLTERSDGRYLYRPIFAYTYEGQSYSKKSFVSTSRVPELGSEKVMFISPENPEDSYANTFALPFCAWLFLGLGVIFLVLAILLTVTFA